MQSLLQYRRLGRAIQDQLIRNLTKREDSNEKSSRGSSSVYLQRQTGPGPVELVSGSDQATPDLEKGVQELPASQNTGLPDQSRVEEDISRILPEGLDEQSLSASEPTEEVETEAVEKGDPSHEDPEDTEPIQQGPEASENPTSRTRGILNRVITMTNQPFATGIGYGKRGVNVRTNSIRSGKEPIDPDEVFVVGWNGEDDKMNPHNWTTWTRIGATANIAAIGAVVGFASSIDSSALTEAADEFGVSLVVESLATGLYLIGFGLGALFAGPVSETLGRNPVYISTLSLFMVFVMASGLSPNIGAQMAFRFIAGFFGSTPLTCAGGSMADLWTPMERVWAYPIFANAAFMGPILGPMLGGFISSSPIISWRWVDWITLIIAGLVLLLIFFTQPETYCGVILMWKAKHLRELTGDNRYRAPMEMRQETFFFRLRKALYRPFVLTAQEPIIILITLYLTVIYIVLFTFLDGFDYIFRIIHGTSEGLTGLCFLGIGVGLCLATAQVPLIYSWAKRDLKKIQEAGGKNLPPEFRLWTCMLGGSIAIPVSLFWMGWTTDPNISIWSPLIASVFFGYGILCVFISSYQYIIDCYEIYSASALTMATVIRFIVAGGMVVVGIPFYKNEGVHYTLTILGSIAALMAPIPYIFYKYGTKIRAKSKYAVTFKA